jgi:hypothetical protein
MSQRLISRFWWHTLLITLIMIVAGVTTFAMLHRHTTKAATPTSFTVTYGDTYLFTNKIPGAYATGSDTVALGTWSVVNQTTGANIGDIAGGTTTVTESGTSVTENTMINAPEPLGKIESSFTTFPALVDYTQSAAYQNDIQRGYTPDNIGSTTPMGDAFLEMKCPNITQGNPYCNQLGVDTDSVTSLGAPGDPARQAMDMGIGAQNKAWQKLQQITALAAPSQQLALADHLGGGPRATLQSQRPAFAPLVLMFIGVAAAATEALVSRVCNLNYGCSKQTNTALAIVSGIIFIVGIIMTGAGINAAIAAAAENTTIATGQMAAGFELTQAAMANGTAMPAVQARDISATLPALAGPPTPITPGVVVTLGEGVQIDIAYSAPLP